MRIQLPEKFSGLSVDGKNVTLGPVDADGCVNVPEGIAEHLLSHGGKPAPDPIEESERIEREIDASEAHTKQLHLNKPKAR